MPFRFFPTAIAAAVAVVVAYAAACAQAVPAATPRPEPVATTAPAPYKLIATGPQYLSFGLAVAPRVQSEFRPGSTTGRDGFQLWQSGETVLLGRFRVASYNDIRLFSYDHVASDPVATIGGGGATIVPSFRVDANEFESGGGVELVHHVYAGLTYFAAAGNVGYPHLHGIGYLLMLQPEWHAPISPYAQVAYEANAGGNYTLADQTQTALTYRGLRYRAGVLVREPGTRFAFDAGYAGENLQNRTNAPAALKDGMLTLGLDVRF
jgi:hypothetical protein